MPDGSSLFPASLRQPPANIQAEQALLGALLANNRNLDRCIGLDAEHFADPINGRVFQQIRKRIEIGRPTDTVALRNDFEGSGMLDEVGGTAYLAQLLTAHVGNLVVPEYARVIIEAAQRRSLIEIAQTLYDASHGGSLAPAEAAAVAVAEMDRIAHGRATERLTTLDAAMDGALADLDQPSSGLSTGFRALDERLGGLEPGLVYVIAGRPGMGKSALAHRICINVARSGVGVLEVSLEMSARQLATRALATAAGVPMMAIKRGNVHRDFASRLVLARQELAGLPLLIDDSAGQTPAMIAAKARAARRRHKLGLVMIDHLNLMRAEDSDARHGGTWAIGRASNTVLQLAKDCEVPVILCVQLNRGPEQREDKRPTLADLRQSGDIEQDAYAVGMVYRAEYYLGSEPERTQNETSVKHAERVGHWRDAKERVAGKAELIWQKIRDGEPGTDRLAFHAATATFGEPGDFGSSMDTPA